MLIINLTSSTSTQKVNTHGIHYQALYNKPTVFHLNIKLKIYFQKMKPPVAAQGQMWKVLQHV